MDWLIEPLFASIANLLMMLSSFVLIFSGAIFDWVVKFTIIDLARNIGGTTGVGGSITNAWVTLRDLANMCFIFVLLFAAFKAMFQPNFGGLGTTIRNIIIIALLINFSLFFSKVVIDASNIVSVGFYNNIVSSNNQAQLRGGALGSTWEVGNFRGISGGYMNMLGMQTLYSANFLNNPNITDPIHILVIGIMSAIFMLIAAVILLIAGIMFAARFVILVFLMILSPLALIAFAIPGGRSQFEKWKNALIDQSFFAPLYFALTWVVFRLGNALRTAGLNVDPALATTQSQDFTSLFSNPGGAVALIVNYVLIIGFSIAALVFAKQMATRTAGFKIIAGGIGTAAVGGAALAGRKFVGGSFSAAANSGWLKDKALEGKYGSKYLAKAGLWAADKGSRASFDVRGLANTGAGKAVGAGSILGIAGKVSGEGGYKKWADKKKEGEVKADKELYGQTEEEKAEAKRLEPEYNQAKFLAEQKIKDQRLRDAENNIAGRSKDEAERFVKYIKDQNKKNIFSKDDYKNYTPEWDTAKIKLDYERYANATERRMESRAKEIEKWEKTKAVTKSVAGGFVGGAVAGPLGAAVGTFVGAGIGETRARFNKSLARKMRDDTKKPSKEKQLANLVFEQTVETSETPATPTSPAGGAATGGGSPTGGNPPSTP